MESMQERVRYYFDNTQLFYKEMAQELGVSQKVIFGIVHSLYDNETIKERTKRSWSRAKTEGNNHMRGKTGEQHPNYAGPVVSDGKGYLMVLKPEWYTGRKGNRYVFQHSVVMCEMLGMTEVPAGFVVHHIDRDKTNNTPINLALLTMEAHSRLHQLERATTIHYGVGSPQTRSASQPLPQ